MNRILRKDNHLVRILAEKEEKVLYMEMRGIPHSIPTRADSRGISMPKITSRDEFAGYEETDKIGIYMPGNLSKKQENMMWQRMNMLSQVLACLWDKKARNAAIRESAEKYNVSPQKVRYYLKLYLMAQDMRVLAPKEAVTEKELTEDQKNFRWALNKFYYNRNKNSLVFAYKQMLLYKYCDETGILERHPSFYQFRYFFRKTHSTMNGLISREGKTKYERDYRPLITEGITEYASAPGVYMLDGTVLDIYLVNDSGEVVGRPLMTACVDAYSGMCCGYSLSWEGGVYSVVGLMINVMENKVNYCKKFGIEIAEEDWACHHLPSEFVTDEGSEYISETFSQITELGCTITNLPAYRPERKGAVEQFFDRIQEYYKPELMGRGVIMPDFQERGGHDYRKDACLTMEQFEAVILRCILYDIKDNIKTYFPYTKEMLNDGITPTAAGLWNYAIKNGTKLREVDKKDLLLTLLPRTKGIFYRKGLKVNKMFYFHPGYTEKYLSGGECMVAYNPDNISTVYLIENGYVPFELIQKRYQDMEYDLTRKLEKRKKELLKEAEEKELQASIDLLKHIQVIRDAGGKMDSVHENNIKNIRENRKIERTRRHKDYLENEDTAD